MVYSSFFLLIINCLIEVLPYEYDNHCVYLTASDYYHTSSL